MISKMVGVALTKYEKEYCPKLKLHNSASSLNSYIKENHRLVTQQERIKNKIENNKNNKLLEGLNIKTKIIKKEVIVKTRDHADTETLRRILKMIPITPIHTKPFSKIIKVSKRVTEDGCKFLRELNLIHSSGQNRYRRNGIN